LTPVGVAAAAASGEAATSAALMSTPAMASVVLRIALRREVDRPDLDRCMS
jgi:hypothetical protein